MATFSASYLDAISNVTAQQPLSTGKAYVDIQSARRYSLNTLWPSDMKKAMHLSHTLRDTLMLAPTNRGVFHGGAGFTTQNESGNTGFKLTQEMAYHYNYLAWSETEVEPEMVDGMGDEGKMLVYKSTMMGKLQEVHLANANTWESAIWGAPDQAAMFTNMTKPVSIPTLISEEGYYGLQADGTNLTSVYNATQAVVPAYDNQRYTYAALGGSAANGEDLIGTIEDAWLGAKFEGIPEHPEYGPGNELTNIIFCSNWGIKLVLAALRNGQTQWGKREITPYGVRVDTLLFKPIDILGTAELYDDGSGGLANEANAAEDGPRYYGVNLKSMKFLCQKGHFQRMEKPVSLAPIGKPYDYHQGIKSKMQMWCVNRRDHFIVSPTAAAIS